MWCFGLAAAAKGSPPSFVQKPAIRQVEGNVIIECKLSSDPASQITWLLNNTVVQSSDRYQLSQTQANGVYVLTLQISKIGVQDGGEYKVLAKNARGEATATINLNLEGNMFPAHFFPWHFLTSKLDLPVLVPPIYFSPTQRLCLPFHRFF